MDQARRFNRWWLITAAAMGGAALGAAGIASAATTSTGPAVTKPAVSVGSQGNENTTHERGESAQRESDEKAGKFGFGGGHSPETEVTGATADKIRAAALAAVPGTPTKTEQRADGTYEVEITKTDGSEVHVSLDKNFVVMSTDGHGGGPGNSTN